MKEQIYDTHYIVFGKLDSAQRLEGKITCALKEMYWSEDTPDCVPIQIQWWQPGPYTVRRVHLYNF